MNETRGITVKIDAALHARAKEDQEARELTMSQYITLVLKEHFSERPAKESQVSKRIILSAVSSAEKEHSKAGGQSRVFHLPPTESL